MLSNLDFIAHAFAGLPHDESPWSAGFPGDPATVAHCSWHGTSAVPLPSLIRDTNNNYICISTFRRSQDGRYHRRLDCWSGLWLILLDDLGTKVQKQIKLKPSCLVETSPDNYQAWLFLSKPERDRNRAEDLVSGIIQTGASDPGAGNLTRYGRLPVGINGKAKYLKRGKPFVQRIHTWQPERRYSVEEIAEAYGFDLYTRRRSHLIKHGNAKLRSTQGDGYLAILEGAGLYIEPIRSKPGAHRITCPWHKQHTDADTSGTAYFEPGEINDYRGGFKCQHGHCAHRTIADIDHFIHALLRKGAA